MVGVFGGAGIVGGVGGIPSPVQRSEMLQPSSIKSSGRTSFSTLARASQVHLQ